MARAPRNKILKLNVSEISAVDDPANQHATVDLFKAKGFKACDDCTTPGKCALAKKCAASDESAMKKRRVADAIAKGVEDGYFEPEIAALAADILKGNTMADYADEDAIAKALATAEERLDALEKANVDATAALAAANARADAAEAALAKARAGEGPSAEEIDEEVLKSLPAAVRIRLEKAADTDKRLSALLDSTEQADAIAKARTIGIGKAEDVGPLLVRIGKGKTTADDAAKVEALLKAAAAQAAAGGLFKSIGEHVDDTIAGDPETLLKAKVADIMKANPTMTAAQAETAAFEAEPRLYDAIAKAKRA